MAGACTQPENCLTSYEPHGYCVIYSSADRDSFILAERILQTLWTSENIAQKAVILVGNKADLARSRTVTSEGKSKTQKHTQSIVENTFLYFLLENISLLSHFYDKTEK